MITFHPYNVPCLFFGQEDANVLRKARAQLNNSEV